MARKSSSDEFVPSDTPMTFEEWAAQPACPECAGRPGYNPVTGVELKNGHAYICSQFEKVGR